jgi:pterin-4a-carbinolamine dehydratase
MKFIPNGITRDINIVTNKEELERLRDLLNDVGDEDEPLTSKDVKLAQQIEDIIKVN